jgi:hypothetical protein
VSQRQKEVCSNAGLRGNFKTYTPANTGLDTTTEFPELGSSFKAASVKTSVWFFAKLATEISGCSPEDRVSKGWSTFFFHQFLVSVSFHYSQKMTD